MKVFGSLGVLARQQGNEEKAVEYFSSMMTSGQQVAAAASNTNDTDKSNNVGVAAPQEPQDIQRTITEFAVFTVQCADLHRIKSHFRKAAALAEVRALSLSLSFFHIYIYI